MTTQEKINYWLKYLSTREGYTEVECTGYRLGYSELLMCTGMSQKEIAHLFVNSRTLYAYAITTDGSITDGCYHLFEDGTVSLS